MGQTKAASTNAANPITDKNILSQIGWQEHIDRHVSAVFRRGWVASLLHGVVKDSDDKWRCTCKKPDCSRPGTHPAGATWDAVTCTTMEQWASLPLRVNRPNYAVRLESCNLVVVDIDHHPTGPNGVAEWRRLTDGHQESDTFRVISGSRAGEHWYFEREDWMQKAVVAPGIELLMKAITGPGSRHRTGLTYAVLDPSPVAKMPVWMADEFKRRIEAAQSPRADGQPAFRDMSVFAEGAPDGSRNNALAAIAGHLLAHHIDPHLGYSLFKLYAANLCFPPVDDNEADTIWRSIAKKELRRRQGRRGA